MTTISLDGSDLKYENVNAAHTVIIKPSTSTSGSYTLILPVDDGATDQVLTTNGSGVLSWAAPSASSTVTLANDTTDQSDYLIFSNGATGAQALKTNTNIRVNPATATGGLTTSNTTDATSTLTGAIITAGGVGIAKKLYTGNNISIGYPYATLQNNDEAFIQQGYSCSVYLDTALVGGLNADSNLGAVWVWIRNGSTWTQQEKLQDATATGAVQGASCSIYEETALVGGPLADSNLGAVWVYTRSGVTWTLEQKLQDGTATGAQQGTSCSIYQDTTLVGGYTADSNLGAVWVYTRSGVTWTLEQKLQDGAATGARQGQSCSVYQDTALVGGYGVDSDLGAVWVYTRSGVTWTLEQKLQDVTATNALQGFSCSIYQDTALVGGFQADSNLGAVWVYTRSGVTWTLQQKLQDVTATGAFQGRSCSVYQDTVLVGGTSSDFLGAVWVYTRSSGVWTVQKKIQQSAFTSQGFSCSVYNNDILVGANAGYRADMYTSGLNQINNATIITDPTISSSSSTGALLITGGLGIAEDKDATSATNGGSLTTAGGVGIAKKLYVGDSIRSNTSLILQDPDTSANTVTIAASASTSASYSLTLPVDDGASNQVLTTDGSGVLSWTTTVTPAALTKADDTNVTLTLGGTPNTALLQATSITAGWTGILSGTRGGTGVNNGSNTITLAGNLATAGAFASTFTMTGATAVTFPIAGTLANMPPAPTIQKFTSGTSTYNKNYAFLISTGSATLGDQYTNNSITYTVHETISSSTLVIMRGSGAPTATGTLTKFSGSGDATLTFSYVWAPNYLKVQVVGGGGGGGGGGVGGGDGGTGGNSSFDTTALVGNGGEGGSKEIAGGKPQRAGGGGTASTTLTNAFAMAGGGGGWGLYSDFGNRMGTGGIGGNSFFAGAGYAPRNTQAGVDGGTNTGGGGSGGSALESGTQAAGSGGGGGGYAEGIIRSPSASYPYVVGAGGTAGTAGGNGYAGGTGAAGIVIVTEHYI